MRVGGFRPTREADHRVAFRRVGFSERAVVREHEDRRGLTQVDPSRAAAKGCARPFESTPRASKPFTVKRLAASIPPVTTASQMPARIQRAADAIAFADDVPCLLRRPVPSNGSGGQVPDRVGDLKKPVVGMLHRAREKGGFSFRSCPRPTSRSGSRRGRP